MTINFQNNDKLVVKSDPAVQFSNGMTLWLAKEGETYEITQYDWDLLHRIDNLTSQLGKYRYVKDDGRAVVQPKPSSFWNTLTAFIMGRG